MNFHQEISVNNISYIKNASTAHLTDLFEKLKLKQKTATQHLWFNKQCTVHKIKPKYVHIKMKSTSRSAQIARKRAEIIWIKEECRRWYAVRDNTSFYLKVIYSELAKRLHPLEFDITLTIIFEFIQSKIQSIYQKQNKKLNNLKQQQIRDTRRNSLAIVESPIVFYDRVINLSNTTFTNKQTTLLNKSLKHCPKSDINHKTMEKLAVDLEVALGNDITQKHICADVIRQLAQNTQSTHNTQIHNNEELRLIKQIKRKVNDQHLVITKADKGNTTVILPEIDYKQKIREFLDGGDFSLLRKDPTVVYQQNIRNIINNTNLFSNVNSFFLTNMNPLAPSLYGLPKLHKQNIPIRPVVSYINAPSYKLSKFLVTKFLSITQFKPKFTVINSQDLIDKIKDIIIPPNAKLVSFDVCNLFSKIPTTQCKQVLSDLIWSSRNIDPITKNDLENSMFTCMDQNYFHFDNKIYRQNDGLAMGSPLSPLLADVFMNHFESKIFQDRYKCANVVYWYRYVDDIICLWSGTDRQLSLFLNYINSIENNIKLTLEIENNKTLNFLDLQIYNNNNIHNFRVYRKPTFSDAIIHSSSNHPIAYKYAAFHSMLHRMISIPMNENDYKTELNTIKQIARNNGYEDSLIDALLRKKIRNIALSQVYPLVKDTNNDKRFCRLGYVGDLSNKLVKKLDKSKYRPVFYANLKLRDILNNSKSKIDPMKRSGVYKLTCDDCQAIYIGQTGRAFTVRCKEHLSSNSNSNFSIHLREENHKFNVNNLEILHFESKGRRLNALESLEINKLKDDRDIVLLNDQTNLSYSPLLQRLNISG